MELRPPWAEALGISTEQIKAWQSQGAPTETLLEWCLDRGYVNEFDYLDWAREFFKIPVVKSEFFEREVPKDLWASRKNAAFHASFFPILEWDGTVFVGCLAPPVEADPSIKVQPLLAPYSLLKIWWEALQGPKTQDDSLDSLLADLAHVEVADTPAGLSNLSELPPPAEPTTFDFDQLNKALGESGTDAKGTYVTQSSAIHDIDKIKQDSEGPAGLSLELTPSVPASTATTTGFKLSLSLDMPAEHTVAAVAPATAAVPTPPTKAPPTVAAAPTTAPAAAPATSAAPMTSPPPPPPPFQKPQAPAAQNSLPPPPPVTGVRSAQKPAAAPAPAPVVAPVPVAAPTPVAPTPVAPPKPVVPVANAASAAPKTATLLPGVATVFQKMKDHFNQCMVLGYKNEKLLPWQWDQSWYVPTAVTEINAVDSSVFRIVIDSKQPYHGFVSPNEINSSFFNQWNQGAYPQHLTILPLIHQGELVGMLLGTALTERASQISLLAYQALANDLASQLKDTPAKAAA